MIHDPRRLAWVRDYVGIPFKPFGYSHQGCHCWGLVYLVQSEQFKRWIPKHDSFEYQGTQDAQQAESIIVEGVLQATKMKNLWFELEDPKQVDLGDIILLRLLGRPIHCAVAISGTHMLHIQEGANSVCEQIWGPLWERRVSRVYRYTSEVNSRC